MMALGLAAVLCIVAAVTGVVLLFKKTPAKAAVWDGTAASSFAGGNGTSGNPYQIATGQQLKYLADLINKNTSASTYNTTSIYYKLTANIELNTTTNWTSWSTSTTGLKTWSPIGASSPRFNANFNGSGFTVSGIYVTGGQYIGLFGYCNGGTITNLGVEKSYFYSTSTSYAIYAGGIAGCAFSSTIENCYNTGKVIVEQAQGYNCYVGGVAGSVTTMKNCYNTGTIYGSSSHTNGTPSVGGVVGSTNGTTSNNYFLSGCATQKFYGSSTATEASTKTGTTAFDTTGAVTTTYGSTLLAALNGWVTANNGSLNYIYWKDIPYPTFTGNVYNTYTVTYSYNGATGNNTTTSATVTYNSSYTLVVPTCTGYAFAGWWTATSGGTQYTNASGSSLSNWSGTSNITLYAQWTANSATFIYNANNGTMTGNTSDARSTATTTALKTTVTRTGYTFTGWWTATSGGTQITNASGAPLVASGYCTTAGTWLITGSSITVYAQWTANTYTLTYNYNNATGNNSTASATVTYNSSYNLVVPTRTGYAFTGWWSATSGGTQYTNASGASLANWTGTAGITIYAQWTANTYTLTYNFNNATGNNTTASATVTYDSSYTLIVPTRTGHSFTGWWSATSSGTQYTNASGVSLANWTGSAGINIYAQWTGYNYTVRFNANNGTGSTSTQPFVYGTAQVLTSNPYTKQNFKFMGWATSQANADNGIVTYTNSQSVNELTTTNNGAVDLYAVWSTNFATYYLCYAGGISADGNSGYVTPGVAIALPTATEMAAYAPTGMTFAGWYENTDLSGTAVTQVLISTAGAVKYYYAKWV